MMYLVILQFSILLAFHYPKIQFQINCDGKVSPSRTFLLKELMYLYLLRLLPTHLGLKAHGHGFGG